MSRTHQVVTVLRFELLRSIAVSRVAVWVVLTLFPPVIFWLILHGDVAIEEPLQFGLPLLLLIPQGMCLLGLLLWATPVVQNELEGKTWIYVAVRPGGKLALLLGKYLCAVIWTAASCWISLALTIQVASAAGVLTRPLWWWLVYSVLTALATLGYGALFVLIGVAIPRRAMVVAVAYGLLIEYVITMIPAVINKLTLAYHLRCLLFAWMQWPLPADAEALFLGRESAWVHLLVLPALTVALLVAAGLLLHNRQYIVSEEN